MIILLLGITFLNPNRLCLQLAVSLPFALLYLQHTCLLRKKCIQLMFGCCVNVYVPVAASEKTQRHCDCTPCTRTLCLRGIDIPSPISASTASETVKLTSGFPGCCKELQNCIWHICNLHSSFVGFRALFLDYMCGKVFLVFTEVLCFIACTTFHSLTLTMK